MDREQIISRVKDVLPNENDNPNYDKVIEFAVDKTIADTDNYTNIPKDELPDELEMTIAGMSMQLIMTHEWLTPEDDQTGNVQSLSEGDTSVSFKSASEVYQDLANVNAISDNYVTVLNNFRRLSS